MSPRCVASAHTVYELKYNATLCIHQQSVLLSFQPPLPKTWNTVLKIHKTEYLR